MPADDHYPVLGVSRIETAAGIRAPYRELGRRFNPEHGPPPMALLGQPASIRPSLAALRDRLMRNVAGVTTPKGEHLEPLNLQAVLSPEEAATGLLLRVAIPIFRTCPACDGTGRQWLSPCTVCAQEGVVETEKMLHIRLPAMARPPTVLDFSLHELAGTSLFLRVQVAVTD